MRGLLTESRNAGWACLALVVAAVYANALDGNFQFDDYNVIVNNPRVHTWQAWLHDVGLGIRPILKLSYTFNWTLGLGAAGFHFINIGIHLCNVYLVFELTRHFVRSYPRLPGQVPFVTALLFALHPIHTEAVTYICGRSVALMTLFYLAGLLAYVSGHSDRNRILVYGLTPFCFVAALSVKETAVTFPFALWAWHMAGGEPSRTALHDQWPSWAVLVAGGVFFLWNDSYLSQMERSAALNSLQGNLATQAVAFLYLMRQWTFPFWLNIDPDLTVVHSVEGALPQLLFLVVVILSALIALRRRPWIGLGLAWALIQLLPLYIFLPRLDVANDRQLYLASWPLALALVSEMAVWMKQKNLVLAGVSLALVFGGLTMVRNKTYQSEVSLWEDTANLSPGKARVHNNLGYAYALVGRKDEARHEFAIALKLDPDYYKARNNSEQLDN
jgi:hypothetical protein